MQKIGSFCDFINVRFDIVYDSDKYFEKCRIKCMDKIMFMSSILILNLRTFS